MAKIVDMVAALGRVTGVSFVSFTYKAVGTGEVARHLVNVGASTANLYEKDISFLTRAVRLAEKIGNAVTRQAFKEVLDSRMESMEKGIGKNSAYTLADTMVSIEGIPNVQFHKDTGEVYLRGHHVSKVVITPGVYKPKNYRSELTAKKDKVRKMLPSEKIRTYKLSEVGTMRVQGNTLIIE